MKEDNFLNKIHNINVKYSYFRNQNENNVHIERYRSQNNACVLKISSNE